MNTNEKTQTGNAGEKLTLQAVLAQAELTMDAVKTLRAMLLRAETELDLSGQYEAMLHGIAALSGAMPEKTTHDGKRLPPAVSDPPSAVSRAPETKQAPAPEQPKSNATRAPIRTATKYDAIALSTMRQKPVGWSPAKHKAVQDNPGIHPDSIDEEGLVCLKPWTWADISYVLNNAAVMTPTEIANKVNRSLIEIQRLLSMTGLDDVAPPEKPAPEPEQPEPDQTTPGLDRYLPAEIQTPTLQLKIKVLRNHCNMTTANLAKAAGIGNSNFIKNLESGSQTVTERHLRCLDRTFGKLVPAAQPGAISSKPIEAVLPMSGATTIKDRIRLIRVRFGCSRREMAALLHVPESAYANLEDRCTSRFVLDSMARTLSVDPRIFDDVSDEPSGLPCDLKQTGLNVDAMMKAKNLSDGTVVKALGISEIMLRGIKSGKAPLTFELAVKLADLFRSDTNAFYAVIEE